jgi:hypothetical protein
MAINRDWHPKEVAGLKDQVEQLKIKIKADLPVEEIVRMQLETLLFASSLTWPVNQARFYEAKMASDKNRAFTKAFLLAVGSDRKRDADAKADGDVRVAEAKAHEAEVYRKLIEDTKQDFIAIHYALRAMLKDRTEDRRWEQ